MALAICCFIFGLIAFTLCAWFAYLRDKQLIMLALEVGAVALFAFASPRLGYGHIPVIKQDTSSYLDTGVPYQTISATREGSIFILVVKKFGSKDLSDYRVLSMNTSLPAFFTMIGNKAVPIAEPS